MAQRIFVSPPDLGIPGGRLARRLAAFLALLVFSAGLAPQAEAVDGANVRIASFDTDSGETYFAASIQPSAQPELMAAVTAAPADVVIVVDTSASQSGSFRNDSLLAAEKVAAKLRDQDRLLVFAADVSATKVSESFSTADSIDSSVSAIKRRLPLGNTNLISVLDQVRASLVARPQDRTRSIVYIGDGSSADSVNDKSLSMLVDSLRADHISVHSIAVGPAINVDLLGVLAHHTGGLVTAAGKKFPIHEIASEVGDAATTSPIWVTQSEWFDGIEVVAADRHPPLRLDRDSIVIGRFDGSVRDGKLAWTGQTSTNAIRLRSEGSVEASHPDFGFLVSMTRHNEKNHGLRMAAAGSSMMRHVARNIARQGEAMVKASKLALQRGNRRGAKAIADLAVEADPNNDDAKKMREITGNRLIVQNDGGLDDIFGGVGDDPFGSAPAGGDTMDLGDDPFGGAGDPFGGAGDAPAAEPAMEGSDDPFGAPAPQAPAPQAAASDAPAAPAPAPPVAPTPPTVSAPAAPAPAAGAPAMADPAPIAFGFGEPVGDADLREAPGELLGNTLQRRTVIEGRLRSEVRASLRESSRQLRVDPTGVAGSLKSLLARVETMPDINPQLRRELTSQVRSAIQIASGREAEYVEQQATLEQIQAAANAQSRLLAETFRRESTLETLSAQMNSLIDQGRYGEADGEVSLEFARVAGDTITRDSAAGRHFTDETLALQVFDRDRRYREMRERNFVDAFSLVLKSNIPFVDEPPVMFPDADVWQRMSRRRLERYGAIELVGNNESERRIEAALDDQTSNNFIELPLGDAIRTISEQHDIPIVVDTQALEENGLSAEEVVSVNLSNVSLRSFMRLMLRDLDLTYMIKDEVMQITTRETAEENLITKVYPVGDLVVPIVQLGGGGQGGGGLGGGGGGGGLGGGGGGGGFGGGGGGGGGFGGGGGGGMFVVPDEVPSETKSSVTVPFESTAPASQSSDDAAKAAPKSALIKISPAEGESVADAWHRYFAETRIDSAASLSQLDASIARTIRFHSSKAARQLESGDTEAATESFEFARDGLAAAISNGHVQPWMYQAYAIALQATQASDAEVERALLSAVDFADTPDDVLNVAAKLEVIGSDAAAIKLCKHVASMEPLRREPYVMGMRLAERTDNTDDLAWAVAGVLGQAWPQKYQDVLDHARLLAKATHARLIEEGKNEAAAEFGEQLRMATSHDVIVRVSWTGDADLDLAVEEPSGTVCASDNITTAGGGTFMGDQYPGSTSDKEGVISESYLCPRGFNGVYRLLIRRIWGNVSSGVASVEILTDIGRPTQRLIQKQVPLTEKDVLVEFNVQDGKRREEVGEAQLAHLRDVARDLRNEVVLGNIFQGNPQGEEILRDLYRQSVAATGGFRRNGSNGFDNPFFRRGAVGFQPNITTLPTGASLSTLAIISADRRYVRVSPAPLFSQIGDVTTFNFVTGEEGAGAGGGIGGGLGGAGFGGP